MAVLPTKMLAEADDAAKIRIDCHIRLPQNDGI